ncbi:hypothetical protein HW511_13070 [Asaia siamensis]|uniref:J domain-containing protein n=1 Tax=Asaia siamensis TaxID=110479 RepID=A0ABQ1MEY9_9PROT|nr:hypothetical protein [Asaia siamensis]GBR06862.1 hypothetical protein AA0323_1568 [Asaia siamensis NRIC 0323]GGC39343.1 hypothetical protein GCM10007207_26070 [Asaia siamensis]
MLIPDAWRLLGLEPTSDKRAVNRAYAQILRRTRPDDDPVGFGLLVEARALALDSADTLRRREEAGEVDDDIVEDEAGMPRQFTKVIPVSYEELCVLAGVPVQPPPVVRQPVPEEQQRDGEHDETDEAEREDEAAPRVTAYPARLTPPPSDGELEGKPSVLAFKRPIPPDEDKRPSEGAHDAETLARETVTHLIQAISKKRSVVWTQPEWHVVFNRIDATPLKTQLELASSLCCAILSFLPNPAQLGASAENYGALVNIVTTMADRYGLDSGAVATFREMRGAINWGDWIAVRRRKEDKIHYGERASFSDYCAVLPLGLHLMALFPVKCREAVPAKEMSFIARLWMRLKFCLGTCFLPSYRLAEAGMTRLSIAWSVATLAIFALIVALFFSGSTKGTADILLLAAHDSLKAILGFIHVSSEAVRRLLIGATFFLRILPLLLIPCMVGYLARKRIEICDGRGLVSIAQRAPVLRPAGGIKALPKAQLIDLCGLFGLPMLLLASDPDLNGRSAWRQLASPEVTSIADSSTLAFMHHTSKDNGFYIGFHLAQAGGSPARIGLTSCRPGAVTGYDCKADFLAPGTTIDWMETPDDIPSVKMVIEDKILKGGRQSLIYRFDRGTQAWKSLPQLSFCQNVDFSCTASIGSSGAVVTAFQRLADDGLRYGVALWKVDYPRDFKFRARTTQSLLGERVWLNTATSSNEALFIALNDPVPASLYAQAMDQTPRLLGTFPLHPNGQLLAHWRGAKLILKGLFTGPAGRELRSFIAEKGRIRAVTIADQEILLRKEGQLADTSITAGATLDLSCDGGQSWQKLTLPNMLRRAVFSTDGKTLFAYGAFGLFARDCNAEMRDGQPSCRFADTDK